MGHGSGHIIYINTGFLSELTKLGNPNWGDRDKTRNISCNYCRLSLSVLCGARIGGDLGCTMSLISEYVGLVIKQEKKFFPVGP